ncbi:DUF4913 domain-containing protein [Streptodolium elevatio]|uniref:DUF4913 domain-containing protein n=1 Tax=Streptodolium elevatio TaxID=3157996 RepID=A0ABV3DD14_9ACTN
MILVAEPADPEPAFDSLEAFVRDYLAEVLRRRLNRATAIWCPAWWKHPEAIARLSVLWRSFEHMRGDPAVGLSRWWLDHADPHMRQLMDPTYGPFAACDPESGHGEFPPEPLPLLPAPPEVAEHPMLNVLPSPAGRAAGSTTKGPTTTGLASAD